MSASIRRAPALVRAISTSAIRSAAAAPASSTQASGSTYYKSRYARAPSSSAAAASSATPAAVAGQAAPASSPARRTAYTRAPAAATAKAAPAPAPAAAQPAPAAVSFAEAAFDDFDDADFRLPDQQIEDYAHLQRKPAPAPAPAAAAPASSTAGATSYAARRNLPAASPPLTTLPDAKYTPLPSAPGPSTPPAGSGQLGNTVIMDGYVFNGGNPNPVPESTRMPGEMVTDDWTTSFRGLSERPFDREVAEALLRPLHPDDVEIKPDGLLYLPEIKYRRTLNAAFGPGGWGMAPRGETHIGPRIVSREWGLVCLGRLVAIARGEQEYFDPSGVPTATEACKSNALMRCCKDLGIGSELWDPRFIREFKAKNCVEAMVEHVTQKRKRKLWRKKDQKFEYPYKEISAFSK